MIENGLNMSEDFRYLSVQLQIEQSRLRDFSQAAGLTGHIDEDTLGRRLGANKVLLLSTLTEVKHVLEKFAKENEEHQLPHGTYSDVPNPSHGQGNLGEAYSSLVTQMSGIPPRENKFTGVAPRFKWGLLQKDEFVRLLQRLRTTNDYLHELLDEHQTQILHDKQQETYMELVQVRNSVNDLKVLAEAAQSLRRFPHESLEWQQKVDLELENLAAFKAFYASLLTKKYTAGNLKIPACQIQFEHVGALEEPYSPALFVSDDNPPKRVWINRQSQQSARTAEKDVEEAGLSAIEELTALLIASKPDEFCVPPCLGYCNLEGDQETQSLGLVFENPPGINSEFRAVTLLQAIQQHPKPSLTQRVALAHKIAQCLLYLHAVNWLHKGLRSENILVFPSTDGEYDFASPYLTGFNHSRRARFNEATIDVPRVGSMEVYRHPDIQMNGPILYYRKSFDIYSVGIVLIEIAHWRSIASVMGIEESINVSPKATSDVQERLLSLEPNLLRALQAEVGDKYASAVRTCIAARDSFGIPRVDLETSVSTSITIQQGFNAEVVRVLRGIVM